MNGSDRQENDRQYRLIDQMMTAHAVLRDRYKRRSRALSLSLLSLALVLNAFVFASDDMLNLIFLDRAAQAKIVLSIVSVGLLVLSVIEFRVDWEGRGRSHEDALVRLSRLKARYREAHTSSGNIDPDLAREYAGTMDLLPAIPERLFIRLKAYHTCKRLLSQELDKHPGVPAWVLRLLLRWRRTRSAIQDRHKDDRE